MEKSEIVISESLFVIKAFAILSVTVAHCAYTDMYVQRLTSLIGTIGVPVFLIVAGYYFNKKEQWNVLAKKKIRRIVVPWIFMGGGTYLISVIAGGELSFIGVIRWILGFGTWLYYVPVILFCFAIFRAIHTKLFLLLSILVTFINVMFTTSNGIHSVGMMAVYQNPLNWIGFFSFGMLLKENDCLEKYLKSKKEIRIMVIAVTVIVSVIYYSVEMNPSYWSWFSICFEILCFFSLFEISLHLRRSRVLIGIGKSSYFIFFTHMQIGIFIANRLLSRLDYITTYMLILVSFIKPIIIVVMMYALVCVIKIVLRIVKRENVLWIFGL